MSWCLIVCSLPHCLSFDGEEFEGRKTIVYSNARAWSRLAFVLSCFNHVLFFCNSITCSPPISSVHGDSPGKNTGVGCHALLQGTFPTQGSKLCLLHLQVCSLPLLPPGKIWLSAIHQLVSIQTSTDKEALKKYTGQEMFIGRRGQEIKLN